MNTADVTLPALVLLAGGKSSRFWPLGDKNLYEFQGVSLLARQLEFYRQQGFTQIALVVPPGAGAVYQEFLAQNYADHAQVLVAEQVGEGQSAAVISGVKVLREQGQLSQDLLIANCNDIVEKSLLLEFAAKLPQLRSQKENLLTGVEVSSYFPGGYLVLDGEHVTNVLEKPGAGNEPSNCVRIVFDYFADVEALLGAFQRAESVKDDVYEVALSNLMASGQKFQLLRYQDTWKALKYPWHLLTASQYYLEQITAANISTDAQIHPTAVIIGNVVIEAGVKVMPFATIVGPAFIGAGVIVGNNALIRQSEVGAGSVVGFASEVARSYLSRNVWLHKNYVGDSILDTNVAFGSNAVTANFRLDEGEVQSVVKGERIGTGGTKLGAIVGHDVRVGVSVNILPGVKIGPNSAIAPGAVVATDVPADTFLKYEQNQQQVPNRLDISKLVRG